MSRTTRALALTTAGLAVAAAALPAAAVAAPVTPTITSAGASFGLQLGGSIYGRVELSGGDAATGTLTFALHGPDDPTCAQPPEQSETVPVAGDGFYRVDVSPRHAGGYRWLVSYSGDAGNLPVTAACGVGGEATVLRAPWWMRVSATSDGVVGTPLEATATLGAGACPPALRAARAEARASGWGCLAGPRPGAATALAAETPGTVDFAVHGPDDATCASAPVFESSVAVTGEIAGVRRSAPFVPAEPGTYRWSASYGGDADNAATAVGCADGAVTTVGRATPAVTVSATAGGAAGDGAAGGAAAGSSATVGEALGATAVLSGGYEAGGELAFALHGPGDDRCAAAPVHTAVVTVGGDGSYRAPAFVATAPGSYRWTASYTGDRRNAPAASGCDATGAAVTVAERPAAPDPPTSPPPPPPAPEPPPTVLPAVERFALAARCVRPRATGAAVTVRLRLRTATDGPLRIRVERALGTAGRPTCPPVGGRGRFDGRYRTVANRRVRAAASAQRSRPARRPARATSTGPVRTGSTGPARATSTAPARAVTLRLRLAPALYRITVTAGSRSQPRRRFLRVLAPRPRR
jgi:hypothetical protein